MLSELLSFVLLLTNRIRLIFRIRYIWQNQCENEERQKQELLHAYPSAYAVLITGTFRCALPVHLEVVITILTSSHAKDTASFLQA